MLVTFKTNAYSDITMFGTAAVALLKIMGQSGNVPGAIMASDVPEALKQLKTGLAVSAAHEGAEVATESARLMDDPDKQSGFDDEELEAPIGLDKRAGPLISLLEAAIAANENVLWDS